MKIRIDGEPDDLIKRCKKCKYCIFEEILTPEQRKIKVLDSKNPEQHIHRIVIEQLCGRQYDNVCPMKYAAMKAYCDDRTAMQIGVVKNYVWDLGKKYKRKVAFAEAQRNWTTEQDLGRKKKESYAKRFQEIWDYGIREVYEEGEKIKKQIFTSDFIYEVIMETPRMYEIFLTMFESMQEEHEKRDNL